MPAATADHATWGIWHDRKIRNWLLAILRFSLTLDSQDSADVLAMADEIDRLGFTSLKPEFSFFLRTSMELCDAIRDLACEGRH
jgi:hypothetical protein